MEKSWSLFLVATGGALGASLRYIFVIIIQTFMPGSFPYETLFVNGFGCLVMGLLAAGLIGADATAHSLRLLLMTGLLGGFTTFSAFSLDSFALLDRNAAMAGLYIASSFILSLAAFAIGYYGVRAMQ